MQGQIVGDIVVKPGPFPSFYTDCPPEHRPINFYQSPTQYAYQFEVGRHAAATDAQAILELCEKKLWKCWPRKEVRDTDRFYYTDYVLSVARNNVHRLFHCSVVREAIAVIQCSRLPLAHIVHGDLTFENILICPDGQIKFIDPGNPRRCSTPSLDRGKLLQSLVMRWEDRDNYLDKQPWCQPCTWPNWATRLDWAFLVTHWVRLVPHWPEYNIRAGFETLREVKTCG